MHPTAEGLAADYRHVEATLHLRHALLDALTDDDLAFTLPGTNPSVGELLVSLGETEQDYLNSFRTFTQQFDYRHPQREGFTTVAALRAWFASLEDELKAVVLAIPAAQADTQLVARIGDWNPSLRLQLNTYREAVLLVMCKLDVYLKAMGKQPPSQQWLYWLSL